MPMHLSQLLFQRAGLTPHQEAFVCPEGSWTFAEFAERTQRLATYLHRKGIVAGDRIAICARNGEFICSALFAAAHLGATLVVVNWRLNRDELGYVLRDSEPTALLSDAAFAEILAPLTAEHPDWVLVGNDNGALGESYQAIQQDTPITALPAPEASQAPAVIMYTSGTTGNPKGAMLPHSALISAAQAVLCTLDWRREDRFLLVAPLFHIGGLSPLVTSVLKGSTCVLLADFDPVQVWEVIARERITSMMSVPLMLQAMFAVAQSREVDGSSLKWISCGASMVPPALIETGEALGISVQQVYGITEFCGAVTFWTPEMGLEHADSHGRMVMGAELKIVDPGSFEPLSAGTEGEVWCRGPMTFSGYWRNPEASAAVLQDGWYRTGDIGRVDAEGFLHVVDRLKDMIISGGENIYPAEIEAVLAQMPGIAEIAVVGRADERWGEIPVACIVRRDGVELGEAEVLAFCRERLASYKCIKAVEWFDALPRNSVGKVLKRQLRTG